MKIIRGKTRPKGLRLIIYGVHGVGKTTLSSKLKNALYLDYEGGTHGIDCAKVDPSDLPQNYAQFIGTLKELKRDHQGFDNLIIDSADQLEEAFDKSVSKEKGIESIFAVDDFFRTQKAHERKFSEILDVCGDLVDSGMNVIFIAHEQPRKVEPLENNNGKTYDHSDLKLSKKCSKLLLQWADAVIFCAFKTYLIEGEKKGDKAHAGGGKRWCFCDYSPDYEAKHRVYFPLPSDCSLDKMSEILPNVMEESVDKVNGVSTSDMIAKERVEAKQAERIVEQPKPVDTPATPAQNLRKLLKQYDVDEANFIQNYVVGKLTARYGFDFSSTPMEQWPESAVNWLCGGMDKIAPKLK